MGSVLYKGRPRDFSCFSLTTTSASQPEASVCAHPFRRPHHSFMLNRPSEIPQTDAQFQSLSKVTPKSKSQHGINKNGYPILLDIPVETLTGITSYLDPPSLFALAKVNRHLNQHIRNDNTWRRAFALQFLGIGPEGNLDDEKILLLRPNERSWRQELIAHYTLIR